MDSNIKSCDVFYLCLNIIIQGENMKKIGKEFIYLCSAIIFSAVLATLLIIAVYCLPVSGIRDNARKSLDIYKVENNHFSWAAGIGGTKLDNFTDAFMLNIATFSGSGSVIDDAMINYYVVYEEEEPSISWLKKGLSEDEGAVIQEYARYWHGYLVWLKPLLLIMGLSDIRVLNMCLQFTLLLWVLLELYKKSGLKLAVPYAVAMLSLNPISTALCMGLSCIYNITLIGTLVMLKTKSYDAEKSWRTFLWIGISVAFFDFFTYPIVALGINLLVMLSLNLENCSIKDSIKKMFSATFVWGLGYGGMWFSKWIISFLLTGYNTIRSGLSVARTRSAVVINESGKTYGAIDSIRANYRQIWNRPAKILLLVLLVAVLIYILRAIYKKKLSNLKRLLCSIEIRKIVPFVLVGIAPFVWYAIIINHSLIHAFMTYRDLSITVFVLSYILVNLLLLINDEDNQPKVYSK